MTEDGGRNAYFGSVVTAEVRRIKCQLNQFFCIVGDEGDKCTGTFPSLLKVASGNRGVNQCVPGFLPQSAPQSAARFKNTISDGPTSGKMKL